MFNLSSFISKSYVGDDGSQKLCDILTKVIVLLQN